MSQPFPCYLNSSVANSKTRQEKTKTKVRSLCTAVWKIVLSE